jgi:hypothetical protein
MEANLVHLSYEIELQPGEKLNLPQALVDHVGAGRWLLTVQPLGRTTSASSPRRHGAFLNSYAPEDEGLYDDDLPR